MALGSWPALLRKSRLGGKQVALPATPTVYAVTSVLYEHGASHIQMYVSFSALVQVLWCFVIQSIDRILLS